LDRFYEKNVYTLKHRKVCIIAFFVMCIARLTLHRLATQTLSKIKVHKRKHL